MKTFSSFCVFSSLRSPYITLTGEVVSNGEGRDGGGVKAENLGHKDGIYFNPSDWGLPNNPPPGSIFYHLGSKLLW